jgi:phosphopantetheinyl transferase (holo-ACP synthase)
LHSAGNDIIDLNLIDRNRSLLSRFYTKILSAAEIETHHQQYITLDFPIYLWLLWSVKESAYKYCKRLDNDLIFSPVKIKVDVLSISQSSQSYNTFNCSGKCYLNSQAIYFRSEITAEYIHTVVDVNDTFSNVHFNNEQVSNEQQLSYAVRQLLVHDINQTMPVESWAIKKDWFHVPVLTLNQHKFPVSFSHHGKCIAYALKLEAL